MRPLRSSASGFTLIEITMVMALIGLFSMWALPNLLGTVYKTGFKGAIQDFVSTLDRAATAAAESDRRYEVIVDMAEQMYTLREITTSDLSEVLQEEIIARGRFGDGCRVVQVLFDDGDVTREGGKFRVGHAGWQYGGKIVLLDPEDKVYSIVISRLRRRAELFEGDWELAAPKDEQSMRF